MKRYKVMIDYKNFIPISEDEVEKAMTAFVNGDGAVFENGATKQIQAILPDFHAIMGWNYGYQLQAEDYAEIERSKECSEAKQLIADTKLKLSGGTKEHPKTISEGVKQLATKMNIPTRDQ